MEGFDNIINKVARLKRYLEQEAPVIIGREAANHFQQSFYDEGFTDSYLIKWEPSKRKNNSSEWYGFLCEGFSSIKKIKLFLTLYFYFIN